MYFWARKSAKKDSKKSAALGMLKYILDEDKKAKLNGVM